MHRAAQALETFGAAGGQGRCQGLKLSSLLFHCFSEMNDLIRRMITWGHHFKKPTFFSPSCHVHQDHQVLVVKPMLDRWRFTKISNSNVRITNLPKVTWCDTIDSGSRQHIPRLETCWNPDGLQIDGMSLEPWIC